MKVGLFLTGHLRNGSNIRSNFSWLYDNHDVDLYVGTWDTIDSRRQDNTIFKSTADVVESQKHIFDGVTIKNIWIGNSQQYEMSKPFVFSRLERPDDIFADDKFPTKRFATKDNYADTIQRIIDQWYVVKQTLKLCPEHLFFEYDIIIRSRIDLLFHTPLPIESYRKDLHVDKVPYIDDTAICDRMAWGDPTSMKIYMQFGDHILEMYEKYNEDIQYAEQALTNYLIINKININVHERVLCTLADGRR